MKLQTWADRLLLRSRVAHLATSTRRGIPHNVPVCYAFDGYEFYISIDRKPKRTEPIRLRRVRNIMDNPQVSLVIDTYSEDWKELRYVIVQGSADIMHRGSEHGRAISLLRRKYGQYRKMHIETCPIIRIRPVRITCWRSDL